MGRRTKSLAEKEQDAANRAFTKLLNVYRKHGLYVQEDSEVSEPDGNGSGMSHTIGDPHRRDLETHPPYHCVPDDSNDLDTSLEHCASQSGELVHDSNLQMAQELGDYMAAVASLYHISHHRMPPLLQVSRQCGFDVAACALPDCQADGKLNLNKFWIAGYGRVCNAEGEHQYVSFCNCSAEGLGAWSALETQHFCAHHEGACEQLMEKSTSCLHSQAMVCFAQEGPGMCHVLETSLSQINNPIHSYQTPAASRPHDGGSSKPIPCFSLGDLHSLKSRTQHLTQVGFFGHNGFNIGLVLDQLCRTCGGHKHCVHTRTLRATHDPSLVHETGSSPESGMTQLQFDNMCRRMLNEDKSGLKVRSISKKKIPWLPKNYTKYMRCARVCRSMSMDSLYWCDKDEDGHLYLVDPPVSEDSDLQESEPFTVTNDAFLITASGVVPHVTVKGTRCHDDWRDFDGLELGVLNFNNKILFTHEFLQEFLTLSCQNRMTHRGFIRSKIEVWLSSVSEPLLNAGLFPSLEQSRACIQQFLQQPSLPNIITDAIFDYITLLDMDYDDLFACQCRHDKDHLQVIYDNSCGFFNYLLLRLPALSQQITAVIDTIHYASHKSCSPFFNHAVIDAIKNLNSELVEQKNRILNYMKTSISQMGQVRAMVYVRYHLAVLNWAQRKTNIDQRWENPIAHDATVVCDGVRLGFQTRLCRMDRPYETAWDKEEQAGKNPARLAMGSDLTDRIMIRSVKIRSILSELTAKGGNGKISQTKRDELVQHLQSTPELECLLPFILLQEVQPRLATKRVMDSVQGFPMDTGDDVCLDHSVWDIHSNEHHDEPPSALGAGPAATSMYALTGASKKELLPVLFHWSTPAPELVLLPVRVIPAVSALLTSKRLGAEIDPVYISSHAPGIHRLLKCDICWSTIGTDNTPTLSTAGENLLARMLRVCLQSMQGSVNAATRPYTNPFDNPFHDMIHTCSWAPHHPVVRLLPEFRRDRENFLSTTRRHMQEDDSWTQAATTTLRQEAVVKGVTCNKYKERRGQHLTPGLFTVFCARCRVCVAFQLMKHVESPETPWRFFAHRRWTDADHHMVVEHERTGTWFDRATQVASRFKLDALPMPSPAGADNDGPAGTVQGSQTSCAHPPEHVTSGSLQRQTRQATATKLDLLPQIMCSKLSDLTLQLMWSHAHPEALSTKPEFKPQHLDAFRKRLLQAASTDCSLWDTYTQPRQSSLEQTWTSSQQRTIADTLAYASEGLSNNCRIEHYLQECALGDLLSTLPAVVTTACRAKKPSVGQRFMGMLKQIVDSMCQTSNNAQEERVTVQIIVTPQGQAQVVPVHTDETHVVSTMLLGEKVWQVCTAGAGSAGDPCTDNTGSWSQLHLKPNMLLSVPAGVAHRVVSGDQGTVSINFLRQPRNISAAR